MTIDALPNAGATEHSPAKALAWALAIAALLLVVVVLPAEYGVDWTGAGRLLGLTKMGEAKVAAAKAAAAPPPVAPATPAATTSGAVPATNSKWALRTDAIEVKLAPGGDVEYKATLAEGESLVYSWDAGGAVVEFDFHGEPVAGPAGFFVSFEKGTAAKSAGSLRAPFTGTHGWYWKNASTKAVAIQLKVSGFHSGLARP